MAGISAVNTNNAAYQPQPKETQTVNQVKITATATNPQTGQIENPNDAVSSKFGTDQTRQKALLAAGTGSSSVIKAKENEIAGLKAENQTILQEAANRKPRKNAKETLANNQAKITKLDSEIFVLNSRSNIQAANLTVKQKNTALGLFDTFVQTKNFTDKTPQEQKWLLGKMTTAFTDAAKNAIDIPQSKVNMPLWNTVQAVATGKINVNLYNKGIQNGTSEYGYYAPRTPAGDTININTNSQVATSYKNFIETLAHETNHLLNEKRDAGLFGAKFGQTPGDTLWNEYRAFVVGKVASGANPKGMTVHNVLNTLTAVYPKIRDAYNDPNQKAFKDAIDNIRRTTSPTQTFTVNQLRDALKKAGLGSDYLNRTSNTDNNLADLN